jgi:hypothetical protein
MAKTGKRLRRDESRPERDDLFGGGQGRIVRKEMEGGEDYR